MNLSSSTHSGTLQCSFGITAYVTDEFVAAVVAAMKEAEKGSSLKKTQG